VSERLIAELVKMAQHKGAGLLQGDTSMTAEARLRLPEIEQRVCDVTSALLGIPRNKIAPSDRLIEDLHIDSLELFELLMGLEEFFCVTIPDKAPNVVYKTVFTRSPFRLADLAELIYLQQGTGTPDRKQWRRPRSEPPPASSLPFSQLNGRWQTQDAGHAGLFEPLNDKATPQFRRRSDGMRCVLIPAAKVEIGCESEVASVDERPVHAVDMDAFLIDAEPVSTTAFCRFLNSTGEAKPEVVADWFALCPQDDRSEHMLIENHGDEWRPIPGAEKWPMILVSWYGANAYSLWANGQDWGDYRDEHDAKWGSFLPTEAQWEYAARGPLARTYPWGDEPPAPDKMRYGQHRRSLAYQANTLPLAAVNDLLGMSPFGLHHMAGNVWQWCRDWYDETFYRKREASYPNPMSRKPARVRSERGGSWIGPAELCRSSNRRGRNPYARGRCLGFRCVSAVGDFR
jgi:acyl carrier protein